MKTYTEKQVRKKLKDFIATHPTRKDAAAAANCTPSELTIAANGGRVPAKLLKALGFRREVIYVCA